MRLFKFIILVIVTLLFVDAQAQQARYKLLIHNKTHNSYWQVKANKPYQIWLNDTVNLKGYFDEVNEQDFYFVTKDSTYLIKPESVNYLAQISGFGSKAFYVKDGSTTKLVFGVIASTLGSLIFIPSAIASFEDSEYLIGAGVSAAITATGILLIKASNVQNNIVSPTYHLRDFKEPLKLRIVKSTM